MISPEFLQSRNLIPPRRCECVCWGYCLRRLRSTVRPPRAKRDSVAGSGRPVISPVPDDLKTVIWLPLLLTGSVVCVENETLTGSAIVTP